MKNVDEPSSFGPSPLLAQATGQVESCNNKEGGHKA